MKTILMILIPLFIFLFIFMMYCVVKVASECSRWEEELYSKLSGMKRKNESEDESNE